MSYLSLQPLHFVNIVRLDGGIEKQILQGAISDIGRRRSPHILFDYHLNHTLVKFEQNRMVRTTRTVEFLKKKSGFLKTVLTKR